MGRRCPADAARGLQALLDAVDRGELTATSLEEVELLLRTEGAVASLDNSTVSADES